MMVRCDENWQLPAAQELTALLAQDCAVRAIVLKGSLVRGGADRFSDVDLTVVVEDETITSYAGSLHTASSQDEAEDGVGACAMPRGSSSSWAPASWAGGTI